jgi:hypothetical protein
VSPVEAKIGRTERETRKTARRVSIRAWRVKKPREDGDRGKIKWEKKSAKGADAHDVSSDRLLVSRHGVAVDGGDDLVGHDDGDAKLVCESLERSEELGEVGLSLSIEERRETGKHLGWIWPQRRESKKDEEGGGDEQQRVLLDRQSPFGKEPCRNRR